MDFDTVQMVLTTANNVLVVPDVTVRRRSSQAFSIDNKSAPSSGVVLPNNPTQPFSLDASTSDPQNRNYRVAKLKFDPTAVGLNSVPGWHRDAFDPCLCVIQVMDVVGVGPKNLMINLSCTEDQPKIVGFFARRIFAAAESLNAFFTSVISFLKRKSRPQLQEHGASTTTR